MGRGRSGTEVQEGRDIHIHVADSQVALGVKNPPANAGDIRDAGSIPESRRSPGVGNGNPLQHSWLENPMDRGAWWATSTGLQKVWHDWRDVTGLLIYATIQQKLTQRGDATVCSAVLSCSVVSDLLWPHGLWPTRLLCPWGFSRQKYWSGLPCPLPGDLPDPGSDSGLLHCKRILYHLNHQGSPWILEWVGSLSLLQGIFLTWESKWSLLHYRQIFYQLSYQGSPKQLYPQ